MKLPHVILLTCDELQAFALGCYGNAFVQTPHIDHLASLGFLFHQGISNSPGCVAARSIMLTGQYTRTCTGTPLNEADVIPAMTRSRLLDPTLPEILRDAGYRTAIRGKWHIHPDPLLVGFDDAIYSAEAQRQYGQYYRRNHGEPYPVEQFALEYELEESLKFIEDCREEPFFLFHNISLPHMPIGPGNMPDEFVRMYRPEDVPLRKNVWLDREPHYGEYDYKVYSIWDYFWRIVILKEQEKPTDRLQEEWNIQKLTAYYYGAITCLDIVIGRLLHALERRGILDDTLIVFTSDHGDQMGSHGLLHKDQLYEESIRIPMIYCWRNGLKSGRSRYQLASLVDLMPTILDLCGIPCPASVQGQSMAPVLRREHALAERNVAFIETSRSIGIRTPDQLFGVEFDLADRCRVEGHYCRYDLIHDPCQMNNLAQGIRILDASNVLYAQLKDWDEETPWLKKSQ